MKIIKYIITLVLLVNISSCEYLDVVPDNIPTIDNAFSDKFTSEKYLFTCYSYLPNYGDAWSNPSLLSGDEIWYPDRLNYNNGVRIARGEQNITNPRMDFWNGINSGNPLYEGIRTCNTFLDKIDGVQDLSDYKRDRWKAEVNFLKAYYHFYLTRMYGPMVITDESTEVSAGTEAIKVDRDPVDSCFNYAVRLIDNAMNDLPDVLENEVTELGRITKPIAAAMKARILITAASPLYNGNPDYATFANKDGTLLFNSTYDPQKWQKAADACKVAIDMAHAIGQGLFQKSDLVSAFPHNDSIMMKMALRSRVTDRWNKEIIWGATSGITNYLQYEAQPRLYPATSNPVGSRHAPTLRIAEQYYSKNGIPIDEDNEFDYKNRYKLRTSEQDDKFYIGIGEQTAALHFDREYRFYADIAFDRSLWFANGKVTDDNDSWIIKNRKGEYSSVFEVSQYSVTGYYAKKLIALENEIRNGTSYYRISYAFPALRLADLYLYYAEALNEVKGAPDGEVFEYIDKIRERAGLNSVMESWAAHSNQPDKPSSKAGMREIIQRERLIEMAFEGSRFWDLRRWKLAREYMNKPIRGWNVLKTEVREYYRVNTLFNQSFTVRDYLWPIRENEQVLNPNLVQNPGW